MDTAPAKLEYYCIPTRYLVQGKNTANLSGTIGFLRHTLNEYEIKKNTDFYIGILFYQIKISLKGCSSAEPSSVSLDRTKLIKKRI
jgi:hypothetical protein